MISVFFGIPRRCNTKFNEKNATNMTHRTDGKFPVVLGTQKMTIFQRAGQSRTITELQNLEMQPSLGLQPQKKKGLLAGSCRLMSLQLSRRWGAARLRGPSGTHRRPPQAARRCSPPMSSAPSWRPSGLGGLQGRKCNSTTRGEASKRALWQKCG